MSTCAVTLFRQPPVVCQAPALVLIAIRCGACGHTETEPMCGACYAVIAGMVCLYCRSAHLVYSEPVSL